MRFVRLTALIALLLLAAACEPKDRRPGLWLSGEVVKPPPTDFSFVADYPEIFVETHPWYGIPFSVTTVIGIRNGKLYVPSIYSRELPFPGDKYWNSIIADHPDVRLKIGDGLYEMTATPVRDLTEYREGVRALADKYEGWARWLNDEDSAPPFAIIRMDPR